MNDIIMQNNIVIKKDIEVVIFLPIRSPKTKLNIENALNKLAVM